MSDLVVVTLNTKQFVSFFKQHTKVDNDEANEIFKHLPKVETFVGEIYCESAGMLNMVPSPDGAGYNAIVTVNNRPFLNYIYFIKYDGEKFILHNDNGPAVITPLYALNYIEGKLISKLSSADYTANAVAFNDGFNDYYVTDGCFALKWVEPTKPLITIKDREYWQTKYGLVTRAM